MDGKFEEQNKKQQRLSAPQREKETPGKSPCDPSLKTQKSKFLLRDGLTCHASAPVMAKVETIINLPINQGLRPPEIRPSLITYTQYRDFPLSDYYITKPCLIIIIIAYEENRVQNRMLHRVD